MKLHLGCGSRYIPGFVHVDAQSAPHVDIVGPVEQLPMGDDSVSLIYASHILEHFDRSEYKSVLKEWFRVLKQGGILRLSVPDFAACAAVYYENGLADGLSGLVGLIVGGQRNDYDYHKMIFDEKFLERALLDIGFQEVRPWDWRATEHAEIDDYSQAYIPHLEKRDGRLMSLNLEAVK
ncbi:class I SAM-dependent methyltransferase [Sulfurirhabdus autotrophica]|uniref:Putative SAM-dependent methyltransferase n=1 Tax=Sulfurirhabdus autotrophica TaxID=1706046 RepID=A0A4R3XX16_9PROT|nr:methyltransferase domain-containing protein [Sulfurirhabdus autotrophica]TCV83401.1 putative SAM-dependent methyltransferase [Sulfurirhabdus autotrophica]